MNHKLLILAFLAVTASSCAVQSKKSKAPQPIDLTVASYNVWNASSRPPKMRVAKMTQACYWSDCAESLGDLMRKIDFDIAGLQETGDTCLMAVDSKGQPFYADGRKLSIPEMLPDYGLIAYSAKEKAGTPLTTENSKGGSNAILYRKSLMTPVASGSFYLGYKGPDEPSTSIEGCKHGGASANAVWAIMQLRDGRKFCFITTHLPLATYRPKKGAPKKVHAEVQNLAAERLIENVKKIVPKGMPSIITGDMNVCPARTSWVEKYGLTSWATLKSSVWDDAFDILEARGELSEDQLKNYGTVLGHDQVNVTKIRYDHILVDKNFKVKSYHRWNDTYKVERDGGVICPSDHMPISIVVTF